VLEGDADQGEKGGRRRGGAFKLTMVEPDRLFPATYCTTDVPDQKPGSQPGPGLASTSPTLTCVISCKAAFVGTEIGEIDQMIGIV
jgi:hypothetical protein